MPNIIDVIHHKVKAYNLTQVMVVIDKPLDFKYEWCGDLLLAEDDGFFSAYRFERGSQGAFGGYKFAIPLVDGTSVEAHGQIWSCGHPRRETELTEAGVSTIEQLHKCYVFQGGIAVLTSKYQSWLNDNQPSPDYHKYRVKQAAPVGG